MKDVQPPSSRTTPLFRYLVTPLAMGCAFFSTEYAGAQEFYTTRSSTQPAAVQQTLQNGGAARSLEMTDSGRSADTLPATRSDGSEPPVASGPPPSDGEKSSGLGFFDLAGGSHNPFRITASVREGYDDNTNTSHTDRNGSLFTNLAAGARYDFGSPRLRLTTNLTGGATFYYNRPGRNLDLAMIYTLSAIYAASSRLTLSTSAMVGWYPQPDVGISGTSYNNQDGSYFYATWNLAANYQWTRRFSTTTSYNFQTTVYSDAGLQAAQGNISQTFGQSFNFQLWPTTKLVAEYRANPITYYEADLNSFGNLAMVGFDHVFNPRSRWNLRAGVEQRFNENPVDGSSTYFGPYFESVALYRFAKRSEIAWSARYGTEQSGYKNITQRQTFRTGFSVTQGLTPRLSLNAGIFYAINYFDQPGVIPDYYQNVLQGNLSLNFAVNRFLSLSGGYQYTGVLSREEPDQEYYRNIVYLGLNTHF